MFYDVYCSVFLVCITQKNAKFHEYRFYSVPVRSRTGGGGIIRGVCRLKMVCDVNILNSVRQNSENLCIVYAVGIYFAICKLLVCFFFVYCINIT